MKFYFTFGFEHTTPEGNSLRNQYVETVGFDYEEARAVVVALFGTEWAMQYSEADFAGKTEKHNLTPYRIVKMTSPA